MEAREIEVVEATTEITEETEEETEAERQKFLSGLIGYASKMALQAQLLLEMATTRELQQALSEMPEELANSLMDCDLKQATQLHVQLQTAMDRFEVIRIILSKIFDILRIQAIPTIMDDSEIASAPEYLGLGKLVLTSDAHVSIKGTAADAYAYLELMGYGGNVISYVHPSTMKATIKSIVADPELRSEQVEINGQHVTVLDLFNWKPFRRASVRKPGTKTKAKGA